MKEKKKGRNKICSTSCVRTCHFACELHTCYGRTAIVDSRKRERYSLLRQPYHLNCSIIPDAATLDNAWYRSSKVMWCGLPNRLSFFTTFVLRPLVPDLCACEPAVHSISIGFLYPIEISKVSYNNYL